MSDGHILVTGGAGYIGSHACYALQKRGYMPITLDNLKRGHSDVVRFGPLIEGDIADSQLVIDICEQFKPIAAMHFADLIDIAESVKNPDLFFQNNWQKSKTFMNTLQYCGVSKIVFSSTASVYGNPNQTGPLQEDAQLNPINPYGESKLKAENALRSMDSMRSVILRYFNAAGANNEAELGEAHEPETHLIPRAILTALGMTFTPLQLNGDDYETADGTAIRDYIHVMDLAEAHILALDYLIEGGDSLTVNLGTGKGFSIKQILTKVEEIIGAKVPLLIGQRRTGDPAILIADNKLALETLKWRPRSGLREIIASAATWHASSAYKGLVGLEADGISCGRRAFTG